MFGINYFSNISVALNVASLRRLQKLAGHENSFGLSLTSFPKSLTCSTYRLLTGDAVRQALITTSDPAKSLSAENAARTISRACQRGSGSSHLDALARQYMNSVDQQESLEATGFDVKVLAAALARLPNIKTVSCLADRHAWGQEDWETLVGIKTDSFLYMEFLISEETNLTVTARKLLAAIAQASVLRRSQGGQLTIEQLYLHGRKDPKSKALKSKPCLRNLQMHKLDIANILEPLRHAFSHFKELHIDICPITQHAPSRSPDVDRELQDSKTALETLTSNPAFEALTLNFYDDYPKQQPWPVHIHKAFIYKNLVTQKFANLRSFKLFGPRLWDLLPALSRFVRAHSATLTTLHMCTLRARGFTNVNVNREAWRPVLQAAAACPLLAELVAVVPRVPGARNDCDLQILLFGGEEKVAAVLAKLARAPTQPGKQLGWVK